MCNFENDELQAFVFKNRGALLTLPAALLLIFGKPSAASVALGLPIALAGELVRCWAVGYSGVTTRSDVVEAPALITAGPYAHVRNPLYVGNFVTALGFAIAFTGRNRSAKRAVLIVAGLGTMAAVYSIIVPHEEAFLRSRFGEEFSEYCAHVPALIPQARVEHEPEGTWNPNVIKDAESKTFASFGVMLAALVIKSMREK